MTTPAALKRRLDALTEAKAKVKPKAGWRAGWRYFSYEGGTVVIGPPEPGEMLPAETTEVLELLKPYDHFTTASTWMDDGYSDEMWELKMREILDHVPPDDQEDALIKKARVFLASPASDRREQCRIKGYKPGTRPKLYPGVKPGQW